MGKTPNKNMKYKTQLKTKIALIEQKTKNGKITRIKHDMTLPNTGLRLRMFMKRSEKWEIQITNKLNKKQILQKSCSTKEAMKFLEKLLSILNSAKKFKLYKNITKTKTILLKLYLNI